MKNLNLLFTLILVFLIPFSALASDEFNTSKKIFNFEASYTGDNINNFSGGIKTGSCYLGMANLRFNFDFENAGFWHGGNFFLNAANTHGATPSADLLGDIQVVSNIEAGNHTYLHEVWVKQLFGKVEFTAGLQDLNVEFANSEYAALFLNSSFGIIPVISNNFSAPIFPLTSLGLIAKWNISDSYTWINALFDGTPTDFSNNPYNLRWQFISGDGLLAISEFQVNAEINKHQGTYKIGAYTHSHIVEQNFNENFPDTLNDFILGIYTYFDQNIWNQDHKSFGVFGQLGFSPTLISNNDFYIGLGMNFKGLFCNDKKDVLGLALAHGRFNQKFISETAIELTYKYQFTKNIFFQPDIQYIINPAGTSDNLRNCLTGNLRFGFKF